MYSPKYNTQAAVMLAREYAKRFSDQGIISLSVNPGECNSIANSIAFAQCKSNSIGNIKTEIFRHLPTMNRALTVSNISRRIHFGPLTTKLVRRWHSGSTPSSTVRSRNSGPAPCPKLWNTTARSASSYTLQSVLATESNLLQYVVPWARIADRARADAYDDEMCAQLWSWLEKEVEGK